MFESSYSIPVTFIILLFPEKSFLNSIENPFLSYHSMMFFRKIMVNF